MKLLLWSVLLFSQVAAAEVVVAVIDTGVDNKHERLKKSLWRNPGETGRDAQGRNKMNNGVDDDDNGFIDDVQGWNFSSSSADLTDHHGHGTHVAGLIQQTAASAQVKLMILKYYDPQTGGENNLRASVQAIDYAVRMKAQIINYSGGGAEPSVEEKAALQRAEKAGLLIVAAAGNEGRSIDRFPFFPASYGFTNILVVNAINDQNQVLASSNYGSRGVHLAALGDKVLSTLPGGYGAMTGTSQATALVSGAAAAILESHSGYSPLQIITHLTATGVLLPSLEFKARSRSRLDLKQALQTEGPNTDVFGRTAANLSRQQMIFSADFLDLGGEQKF